MVTEATTIVFLLIAGVVLSPRFVVRKDGLSVAVVTGGGPNRVVP